MYNICGDRILLGYSRKRMFNEGYVKMGVFGRASGTIAFTIGVF